MNDADAGHAARPSQAVIPYETPARARGITARDVFGVIVRTSGLALALWGVYTIYYLVSVAAMNSPLDGHSVGSMLMFAAFLLMMGVALLKGGWLVYFAYGPQPPA